MEWACMLIRFDLPGDLTSNGWVEIAKAYFPIVPFSDSHADDVPMTLKIFSLSGNWSRSTATWSEISTKIDTLYEYQPDNLINDSGYVEWDITDIVSNWASGTPNYGIIVIPGSSRDNFELEFGLRPFIMLNYIPDIRAIGE